MKYKQLAKEAMKNMGGIGNITSVGHCATRLRLGFKDASLINEEALKNMEGSLGLVRKTDQVQIIIGPNVSEAYNDFLEVSGFQDQAEEQGAKTPRQENQKKNFSYYVSLVGNFSAEIFMPIVPALITGGLILAAKTLFTNYFGMAADSGTAIIILAIFNAAFAMLPAYLGYTTARKLKLEPIMGAFLGLILVNPAINNVEGLDFLGIPVPTVEYTGGVLPIIIGVFFMYYVDKFLNKVLPDAIKYFLRPLLTMIIVVPVTLLIFGPIGTFLSTYVGNGIVWLMDVMGGIAMPIFAALYPYMVMLGLDKAIMPIGFNAVATLGYDPVVIVMGFISNLCIGGSALAVSRKLKSDKMKRGAIASFGLTAVCGVTEPAFYGALIGRPKTLIGTAIGAVSGGLVAGIFGLKSFIMGGCPGLFTLLFFLNPDGSMGNFLLAVITAIVSVGVSFVATTVILNRTEDITVAPVATVKINAEK